MSATQSYDVIIIGAGAAGLMCALTAGQRGKRILLLEHLDRPGAKILISGGGRCNFTNLEVVPQRFLSANPHFCKSALSRYTQHDFIAMVERHGIAYHEKTQGQLFCDGSARQVVDTLMAECGAAGVALRLSCIVSEISRAESFRVATSSGIFVSPALVISSGGLSIPKMGATGFAYDTARRFGLRIVEPRPGLVPLTVSGELLQLCKLLTGVSLEAVVSCGKTDFRDNILFTHRGLSGPAVLQISSYWKNGEPLSVDLLPGVDAESFLKERKRARPRAELKNILGEVLPLRLAEVVARSASSNIPIANLSDRVLASIAENLNRWRITPSESEGWSKAEVTVGGIDTAALSSQTMEVHGVPGLYFIGEAVDVTGWLGGYNFQWAWSSGWCAGQAV
jgi:predicted Rossmann fold flavoprotein